MGVAQATAATAWTHDEKVIANAIIANEEDDDAVFIMVIKTIC
jgi:hypothetical protein